MIIARSPLRICLGGGGTDLPFYALEHGGMLITAAIDKFIYISLSASLSNQTTLRHEDIELVESNSDLDHGIVRETLKLFGIKEPLSITISSSVPAGTGMGSSSSLTVALVKAVVAMKDEEEKYGPADIAQIAYYIERLVLNESGGKQDQYIASYGGIQEMILGTDGSVVMNPLKIGKKTISELEHNLHLFYLGSSRSSSGVQAKVSKEAKIAQLHRIKELGLDLKKSLMSGKIDGLGKNWNEHWQEKKKLASGISNSDIDKIYDLALKNGALGGKLIGAGGGGFLIFYAPESGDLVDLLEAEGLKYLKFKFNPSGAEIFYKD